MSFTHIVSLDHWISLTNLVSLQWVLSVISVTQLVSCSPISLYYAFSLSIIWSMSLPLIWCLPLAHLVSLLLFSFKHSLLSHSLSLLSLYLSISFSSLLALYLSIQLFAQISIHITRFVICHTKFTLRQHILLRVHRDFVTCLCLSVRKQVVLSSAKAAIIRIWVYISLALLALRFL